MASYSFASATGKTQQAIPAIFTFLGMVEKNSEGEARVFRKGGVILESAEKKVLTVEHRHYLTGLRWSD